MVRDRGNSYTLDTNFVRDLKDSKVFTGSRASKEMMHQGLDKLESDMVNDTVTEEPSRSTVRKIVATDIERDCGRDASPSDIKKWKRQVMDGDGRRAWSQASTQCPRLKDSYGKAVNGAEADAELLKVARFTGSKLVTSDKSLDLVCKDELGSDKCITPFS